MQSTLAFLVLSAMAFVSCGKSDLDLPGEWVANAACPEAIAKTMRNPEGRLILSNDGTFSAFALPGLLGSNNAGCLADGTGNWSLISKDGSAAVQLTFLRAVVVYADRSETISCPYGVQMNMHKSMLSGRAKALSYLLFPEETEVFLERKKID